MGLFSDSSSSPTLGALAALPLIGHLFSNNNGSSLAPTQQPQAPAPAQSQINMAGQVIPNALGIPTNGSAGNVIPSALNQVGGLIAGNSTLPSQSAAQSSNGVGGSPLLPWQQPQQSWDTNQSLGNNLANVGTNAGGGTGSALASILSLFA